MLWTSGRRLRRGADTADGREGLRGMMEGDGERAVRGKVSGVGLVVGLSGSPLPDIICFL